MSALEPALERAPLTMLDGTNSFLVTRQRQDSSRRYDRLGVLTHHDDAWTFRYFRDVAEDGSLARLPGLPDADVIATSEYLFPVFAERVLSPRRPDRRRVLDALGLDPEAGAFEIMARNGGRRRGDTIELIQLPTPTADGESRMEFLVHGMRHVPPHAQERVDSLSIGDDLVVRPDHGNEHDRTAHFVTTSDGHDLGWVPAPLSPLIARVEGARAAVAHVNESTTNPHLRLLVEYRGPLIQATEFSSPRWQLVS